MRLLVLRHGIAHADSPDGTDASRALTEEGIARTTEAVRGLARLVERPDAILTSPRLRAAQTADIAALEWHHHPEQLPELGEGSVASIIDRLGRRTESTIMIVGHEPTLSRLVETLCTGTSAGGFVVLKKAGCACLEVDIWEAGRMGGARMLWLATPKMLREVVTRSPR
jgi:phosphohistidine phosphatase